MKAAKRNIIIKVRLSEVEHETLVKNSENSNTDNISEFVRSKILLTEGQELNQLRNASIQAEKQKQKCKEILSGVCSSINQLKAKVDAQNALVKLEQGVKELCHLLR